MIRGNLGAALQGLAVVPLFAGFDLDAGTGRGPGPDLQLRRHGRELRGARLRRGRLRLAVREELAEEDLATGPGRRRRVRTVVEALYDAADDDSATGGPDPVRRLYPIVYRVDAEGAVRLTDAEVAAVADSDRRRRAPADRATEREG